MAERRADDAESDESSEAAETGETGEANEEDAARDDTHLEDVPDGAGCTEIWEHLAERREAEAGDD